MKKALILFLILMLVCLVCSAQQAVSVAGGNAGGTGGTASYTIGQVAYSNRSGTSGSITEGVQQPFEIYIVTGLGEADGINLLISAYPNPAKSYIILKVENYKTENLAYQLFDANGKLLENKKVEGIETSIDMSNLVLATYFLKIRESNKEIKVFKIIKY